MNKLERRENTALSPEPATIEQREGDLLKHEWVLDQPVTTIGRAGDCHVCLETRWVSRVHARILREETGYRLLDAGSKNGVFVNGQRVVESLPLTDGDRIQLAPGLELTFVDRSSTLPLPAAQRPSIKVDVESRQVLVNGQPLIPPLSTAQFDFLSALATEPGRVYSRAELVGAVWPDVSPEGVSDDAVDALVRRLRQRLAEVVPDRELVVTVRGYGFRIDL